MTGSEFVALAFGVGLGYALFVFLGEEAATKISTDLVVGAGLVLALILSILYGGSSELQTTLGSGLIGYLGRTAVERKGDSK